MARFKRIILVTITAFVLCISLAGCSNSDMARQEMRRESENNYGVVRTVTAYSQNGTLLGEWHGKIDVEYTHTGESGASERVDIVIFDGEEVVDRVIISGAIVIVDND